mgnify:CR=1 FL=1
MIATKILGLTAALSKNKKLKIGILLLEVALLAFAVKKRSDTTNEEDIDKEKIE